MRKIEYSQIVRRKLKLLKMKLINDYGRKVADKTLGKILQAVRGLEKFSEKGTAISEIYDIESEYRYLFVEHNYLIYRVEDTQVIVVEMFDEREDFMYKLFGISTTTQETIDFWGE